MIKHKRGKFDTIHHIVIRPISPQVMELLTRERHDKKHQLFDIDGETKIAGVDRYKKGVRDILTKLGYYFKPMPVTRRTGVEILYGIPVKVPMPQKRKTDFMQIKIKGESMDADINLGEILKGLRKDLSKKHEIVGINSHQQDCKEMF
jgi:hypothetical protein